MNEIAPYYMRISLETTVMLGSDAQSPRDYLKSLTYKLLPRNLSTKEIWY